MAGLKRLEAGATAYGRAASSAAQSVEATTTKASKSTSTLGTALSSVGKVAGTAMKVGTIAVGGFGVALGGLGISLLNTKQQAQIAFTSMFGDAGKAEAFIKKIQDFAAITPFEFPQLLTASKNLTVVGVAADRVIPIMRTLGDATSSMGTGAEGIQRAVLALTQMQQKGKITGEEMLQLAEAGVPAWDALATVMGVSVPEAQEKVTKGQGKVNDLFKALEQSAGPALTRVKGMMEQQSQSASGLFSTLKDTVSQISASVLEPFFKRAVAGMKTLADITGSPNFIAGIDKFGKIMSDIAASFVTGFGATVIPGVKWFIDNRTALATAIAGIGIAFLWTNPVGAALAVGGAIITGLGLMKSKSEDLSDPLLAVKEKFLEIRIAVESILGPLDTLVSKVGGIAIPTSVLAGLALASGHPEVAIALLGVSVASGGGISSVPKTRDLGPFNFLGALSKTIGNATGLNLGQSGGTGGGGGGGGGPFGIPTNDVLGKALSQGYDSLSSAELELLKTRNEQAKRTRELTDEEAGLVDIKGNAIAATNKQADVTTKGQDAAGAAADKTKEKMLTLAESLQDGLITLAEALELKLTPTMAGTEEALNTFSTEAFRVQEEAYNLTKAIVGFGMAADRGEVAFARFTKTMVQNALDLQNSALASIFGRGTREELTLQLQQAELDQRLAALDIANEPQRRANAAQIEMLNAQIAQFQGLDKNKMNEKQIEWVDKEIKAREEHIRAIQKQNDDMMSQERMLRDEVQRRITLMDTENRIQQLRAKLLDATLPTEAEQAAMVLTLSGNIATLSGHMVESARILGDSLNPDFDAAARAAMFVTDAMNGAGLALLGVPGRASGGEVAAGQPYWVGEKGVPELFVPGASGAIIPSAMRGGGVSHNTTTYSNSFGSVNLPNVTNGSEFIPEIERYLAKQLAYGRRGVAGG